MRCCSDLTLCLPCRMSFAFADVRSHDLVFEFYTLFLEHSQPVATPAREFFSVRYYTSCDNRPFLPPCYGYVSLSFKIFLYHSLRSSSWPLAITLDLYCCNLMSSCFRSQWRTYCDGHPHGARRGAHPSTCLISRLSSCNCTRVSARVTDSRLSTFSPFAPKILR